MALSRLLKPHVLVHTTGGVWRLHGHFCQGIGCGLPDLLQGEESRNRDGGIFNALTSAFLCLHWQPACGEAGCTTAVSHLRMPQESQLARENAAEAEQLAAELPQQHQPLSNKTRYATPANVQMRVLMRRFLLVCTRVTVDLDLWVMCNTCACLQVPKLALSLAYYLQVYWRSPAYNVTRIIMTILIALLYVRLPFTFLFPLLFPDYFCQNAVNGYTLTCPSCLRLTLCYAGHNVPQQRTSAFVERIVSHDSLFALIRLSPSFPMLVQAAEHACASTDPCYRRHSHRCAERHGCALLSLDIPGEHAFAVAHVLQQASQQGGTLLNIHLTTRCFINRRASSTACQPCQVRPGRFELLMCQANR